MKAIHYYGVAIRAKSSGDMRDTTWLAGHKHTAFNQSSAVILGHLSAVVAYSCWCFVIVMVAISSGKDENN